MQYLCSLQRRHQRLSSLTHDNQKRIESCEKGEKSSFLCATIPQRRKHDNLMSEDSGKKNPPPASTWTTVIDTSKRDEQGQCPIFCARCVIIGNIILDHSPRCTLSQQYKTSEKQYNDEPLAVCICHCCVPAAVYASPQHLVPVADNKPGEYQQRPTYYQLMEAKAGNIPVKEVSKPFGGSPGEYQQSPGAYSQLMANAKAEERVKETNRLAKMEANNWAKKEAKKWTPV